VTRTVDPKPSLTAAKTLVFSDGWTPEKEHGFGVTSESRTTLVNANLSN